MIRKVITEREESLIDLIFEDYTPEYNGIINNLIGNYDLRTYQENLTIEDRAEIIDYIIALYSSIHAEELLEQNITSRRQLCKNLGYSGIYNINWENLEPTEDNFLTV